MEVVLQDARQQDIILGLQGWSLVGLTPQADILVRVQC